MLAAEYQETYKCQVTCDPVTGESKKQKRHRYCQCFIGNIVGYDNTLDGTGTAPVGTSGFASGQLVSDMCDQSNDIINDNDCPLTFRKYCQPCDGDIGHEHTMHGECLVNSCIADNESCDTDPNANCEITEEEATHFGCCESSAIRVHISHISLLRCVYY